MALEVNVSNLSGECCTVTAAGDADVGHIRSQVAVAVGVQGTELRLFSGTQELQDADRLSALPPRPGAGASVSLTLVRRDPVHAGWLAAFERPRGASFWADLAHAPWEVQDNPEVVLAAVRLDERQLRHATPRLRADREFILEAVKLRGGAPLAFAAKALRAEREVVLAAVQADTDTGHWNWAWQHAGILRRTLTSTSPLRAADPALRADRALVLAAVTSCGLALAHASEDLRADKEIALAAVRQHGLALEDAAAALRGDPEVVLAAVRQHWRAFAHATPVARADRALVLAALREQPWCLTFAAKALRADFAIVLAAVLRQPGALRLAVPGLREEPALVLVAWHARSAAEGHQRLTPEQRGVLERVARAAEEFAGRSWRELLAEDGRPPGEAGQALAALHAQLCRLLDAQRTPLHSQRRRRADGHAQVRGEAKRACCRTAPGGGGRSTPPLGAGHAR